MRAKSSNTRSSASGANVPQSASSGTGETEHESSSSVSAPSPESSSSNDGDGSNDDESSSTPASGTTEDRTFTLEGGTVRVRYANGAAQFLWATVNDGFTEETKSTSPQVDVRFQSETHESRLNAWWQDGPQFKIEEND